MMVWLLMYHLCYYCYYCCCCCCRSYCNKSQSEYSRSVEVPSSSQQLYHSSYTTLKPTPSPACSNIITNITMLPNCVFTTALGEGRRAISITRPVATPTIAHTHYHCSSPDMTTPTATNTH